MRFRDVFRGAWDQTIFPLPETAPGRAGVTPIYGGWEPYATGGLQAGHRLVLCRRRVRFLARVARWLRESNHASHTQTEAAANAARADLPVRTHVPRGRGEGTAGRGRVPGLR